MRVQVNVYSAPWSQQSAIDAIALITELLNQGHDISRVFFFFDGVYHGLKSQSPASDEYNFLVKWQAIKEQGVELLLCIAASANRGLLDEAEAKRYTQDHPTIAKCFSLTGLGQWASGFHDSDHIITFK